MVEVEGLEYTYRGAAAPAVRGVGFTIAEGEVFGLLGPSGAGKTTTQNVLIGLLRGYGGRVRVMDRDLTAWGPDYYQQVGVSFELPNHYLRLTARENLDYFRGLYSVPTQEPLALLESLDLADAIDTRVGEFSKGMKVRLNIARSMLHSPKLWFLDEPTAGLDPVNARNVIEHVKRRQQEGATTFITTHNMVVAGELCDRVGFIVDGRLEVVDAPDALRRKYGKRAVRVEYLRSGELAASEFALDGLADNPEFIALLRDAEVETVHSQETTLEHVFLEVTGRGLD